MDTYDRINKLLKEKKITRTALANQTGISYNTLTSLFSRRSKNIEMQTLRHIAICLNTTVDYLVTGNIEFINRSSIDTNGLSKQTQINQVTAMARSGKFVQREITDEQMQAIMTILDGMRKEDSKD